ncbi:unnamed protein product, partial [Iphiclides podalirius]
MTRRLVTCDLMEHGQNYYSQESFERPSTFCHKNDKLNIPDSREQLWRRSTAPLLYTTEGRFEVTISLNAAYIKQASKVLEHCLLKNDKLNNPDSCEQLWRRTTAPLLCTTAVTSGKPQLQYIAALKLFQE